MQEHVALMVFQFIPQCMIGLFDEEHKSRSCLPKLPLGGTCSPKEGLSNAQAHKQRARLKSQAL